MSELKWTPGPWVADGPFVFDSAAGDQPLADCWGAGHYSHAQSQANARLIAAAPDLYEALDALDKAGMIGGHDHPVAFCKCGYCHIRRLLAKARGEAA